MLIKARKKYYKDAGKSESSNKEINSEEIKRKYVRAYTIGLQNNVLRDLPVLESHENFLKTNWFLIGIYIVVAGIYLSEPWRIVVQSLLVIAFGAVPFIWYYTQMKIYYSVWEAEDNICKS